MTAWSNASMAAFCSRFCSVASVSTSSTRLSESMKRSTRGPVASTHFSFCWRVLSEAVAHRRQSTSQKE
ncbi:hypothetical protein TYRP_008661 [Tyrophagus putrescentiae]|nr:hypothetical protein TYRP_008661 [Tyrophagus putrescentiae]